MSVGYTFTHSSAKGRDNFISDREEQLNFVRVGERTTQVHVPDWYADEFEILLNNRGDIEEWSHIP